LKHVKRVAVYDYDTIVHCLQPPTTPTSPGCHGYWCTCDCDSCNGRKWITPQDQDDGWRPTSGLSSRQNPILEMGYWKLVLAIRTAGFRANKNLVHLKDRGPTIKDRWTLWCIECGRDGGYHWPTCSKSEGKDP
jgi:hypothetical protein